jgi:hypothetical protein
MKKIFTIIISSLLLLSFAIVSCEKEDSLAKEIEELRNMERFEFGQSGQYIAYPTMEPMTWNQAVIACENLTFAGKSDWFLPSAEFLRIACKEYWDEWEKLSYWASEEDGNNAWRHDFISFKSGYTKKGNLNSVRCIRKRIHGEFLYW